MFVQTYSDLVHTEYIFTFVIIAVLRGIYSGPEGSNA